jgi:hypothetical protein
MTFPPTARILWECESTLKGNQVPQITYIHKAITKMLKETELIRKYNVNHTDPNQPKLFLSNSGILNR